MKFYIQYANAMDLLTTRVPFAPIRLFDRLICYGTAGTCAYMLETEDGLVLIDALLPGAPFEEMFEAALHAFGYSPRDVRMLLISHGHFDHFGIADFLWEKYEIPSHMSDADNRPRPLNEDTVLTVGGVPITVVSTPGHTPGGLSFLFPVEDEGRPHVAALWGGTSLPRSPEARQSYRTSLARFKEYADRMGADVELCAHPFMDTGAERMQVLRRRVDGIPNPFVMGRENYLRYEAMLMEMAELGWE